MTPKLTPVPTSVELAKAHRRAADAIETRLHLYFNADELAAIKLTLLERARALTGAEVVFELYSDGTRLQCRVNGQPVRFDGVGLVLAWLAFAGIQCRHQPLRPDWVFTEERLRASTNGALDSARPDWMTPAKSWRASVLQALDRAAEAVKPISSDLARAINSLGVERDLLVQKENPQVSVRCVIDAELAPLLTAA